jgi:hypothetical protein
MSNLLESILSILVWGAIIGIGYGYILMGIGIGEGWGTPIGIMSVLFPPALFLLVFFGIWYNPKIQHGFIVFIVSILAAAALGLVISWAR